MISTALMCLKYQSVFSSYLESIPEKPELTSKKEALDIKHVLVLSQGLNNSLHGLILEKA